MSLLISCLSIKLKWKEAGITIATFSVGDVMKNLTVNLELKIIQSVLWTKIDTDTIHMQIGKVLGNQYKCRCSVFAFC